MKKFKLIAILFIILSLGMWNFSLAAEGDPVDTPTETTTESLIPETVETVAPEVEPPYTGGTISDIKISQESDANNTITLVLDKPTVAELRILNLPFRMFVDIPMPYRWQVPDENLNHLPISVAQGFRYGNPTDEIFRVTVDLTKNYFLRRAYVKELVNFKPSEDPETPNATTKTTLYDFNVDISLAPTGSVGGLASAGASSIVFSNDKDLLQGITNIAVQKEVLQRASTRGNAVEVRIRNHLDNVDYKAPTIRDASRPIRIFIDPGHGGRDPGAISSDKTIQEKNLVLDVAKELRDILEQNKEITVILSRDDDFYVPLNDRILWAQFLGAKMFVSIHADKTSEQSDASGLSVYTLSESASDAQTQILANSENQSDLAAGLNLNNDDSEVNNILLSLSQRVKSNESIDLARNVVEQASKTMRVMNNPVRSAGFAVLKLPSTPSVLVELGFLSNPEDVMHFKQDDYIRKVAITLAAGIEMSLWRRGELSAFPVGISAQVNTFIDSDIAAAVQKVTNARNAEAAASAVAEPADANGSAAKTNGTNANGNNGNGGSAGSTNTNNAAAHS
ncbi:MAG: N-acetylmuramoyl-L-alanine amidase [Alphaproteobacteria bacterium]|jgi:N-acetylmuramoyl-L-alanine amidase|nr:N-acetylmuramoyl-L-alanine amidase [Alphaproteobacteria bacterium]